MNFYFECSKILDRLDAKQGSIKGVMATLPEKDRKRSTALVIETLKYKAVLTEVIEQSKLLKEERKKITSLNLALLLVHDVLLSNGIQAGDGPIKQAVLRHKTRLRGELEKLKIKRGVRSNIELAQTGDPRAARIPRYVRVNTLLSSIDEVMKVLKEEGFEPKGPFASGSKGFSRDEHIPDLLLFSPSASFQTHALYSSGKIILQDKASCFPAVVLCPPADPRSKVIDATAAPGNKTSHLSALMGNMGKLYAFERDRRRFSTLKMMLSRAGCKNTLPVNVDFLSIDPSDPEYAEVSHILLDPSCSGSGIVNRLDHLLETNDEEENDFTEEDRLNKLSSFQLLMIKHAMKFPGVKRIVYSTCSVHAAENEHVVCNALKSAEARDGNFKLASANDVLPHWSRRGLPEEMDIEFAGSLIRCIPGEDATNGFFVSCFIRDKHEQHQKESQKRKAKEHDGDAGAEDPSRRKKKRKKTKS